VKWLRRPTIWFRRRVSARPGRRGFDPGRFPRRINLGCGLDRRDDCLNIDLNAFHHPDLVCDVTDLRMLPGGYYDYALASDVLEHIPRPVIQNTLKEWNRILRMDAVLELRVPGAINLLALFSAPEYQTSDGHYRLLQCLFGTQTYEGDYHHFAFTEPVLRDMLDHAGFALETLEVQDRWLLHAVARKKRHTAIDPMYFMPDKAFLNRVYRTLLDREPDAGGMHFYLKLLRSGIVRESIVEAIRNSPEYINKRS